MATVEEASDRPSRRASNTVSGCWMPEGEAESESDDFGDPEDSLGASSIEGNGPSSFVGEAKACPLLRGDKDISSLLRLRPNEC